MKARLTTQIAIALLRARMRQSVVAAVGVTFGIGMFIALVSFMNGLNRMLDGLILNRTAHIRLYNEVKALRNQPVELSSRYSKSYNFISSVKPKDRGKEIYNSSRIIKLVRQDKRVAGVAPKLSEQVFYNAGPIETGGILIGIDVFEEDRLFRLSDYLIDGEIAHLANISNSIFIGRGLADKMLLHKGDLIQLTATNGEPILLKIAGVFQFGIAEVDNVQSYVSIVTARKVLGKSENYTTDIQVKLRDVSEAPKMAKEFSAMFGVDAIDIQKANAEFETGNKIRSTISYAVGVTLLIVAGFGIYNILNMLIYEKMDAIAILKATGFSAADVKNIFISLAIIIGFAGGLIGLAMGYLLSLAISHLPFEAQSLPTIKTYPIDFNPLYYIIGILFALFTTFLSGLLPARKAGKVDPVQIIRGK